MYDLKGKFPRSFFTTMEKSSIDTAHGVPMVNNNFIVLKLDDYNKDCYQTEMNASMCLRGGDACFEHDNKIYVIEFKNCYLIPKLVYEVLEKMYASSIVLMDKLNLSINDIRNKVCFVTVYTLKDDCEEKEKYEENFPNKSMTKIKMAIGSKGTKKIKNIDTKAFNLKKLEKNLYKEVITIPIDYFQRYLIEEGIINN